MIAGLHAVFLLEQLGERNVAAFGFADIACERLDLVARSLGAIRTAWPMWNRSASLACPCRRG